MEKYLMKIIKSYYHFKIISSIILIIVLFIFNKNENDCKQELKSYFLIIKKR